MVHSLPQSRPVLFFLSALMLLFSSLGDEAMARSDTDTSFSFQDLQGWSQDHQSLTLEAFRRSCSRILQLAPATPLDTKLISNTFYGVAGDWREACEAAAHVGAGDEAARAYFETYFAPVRFVSDRSGLFTGYYEPEMNGARSQGGIYQTPILATPPGFKEARDAGKLLPTRAEIEDGALEGQARPIVWLADPIDAFFLHVQGSGRVRLSDGTTMRLAFAGKNGQPYTSIGKVLIARGALTPETVSMQTIRVWLDEHRDEMPAILRQNESYIFFRELKDTDDTLGPLGAEGINLTPGRSMAVDRSLHPLGVLLWLDASPAIPGSDGPRLERLMVAQDTGTAIRGLQRGDVFWGSGEEAAHYAGHMQSTGEIIALLPRALAARH